jgi:antitoxin ParD1/3/4
MPTRNVVITDHQAALIERLVASGHYQNASEVLREGLRLVERQEAEHARRLAAFDAAIAEGEAAIAAGRYTDIDSPEALRAFMASLDEDDAS